MIETNTNLENITVELMVMTVLFLIVYAVPSNDIRGALVFLAFLTLCGTKFLNKE